MKVYKVYKVYKVKSRKWLSPFGGNGKGGYNSETLKSGI